jgi:hypothetical protein
MRLASRTAVVSVVFHIPSLMQLAVSIHDQIQAALGAFEVNMASICCQLHTGLSKEDEAALREQYASCAIDNTKTNRTLFRLAADAEYHLVVVFVTESQPGGGWWSRSGVHASQSNEGDFLRFIGNQVRHLAREALTIRYFGAVCGWNLPGQGVIDTIQASLTS